MKRRLSKFWRYILAPSALSVFLICQTSANAGPNDVVPTNATGEIRLVQQEQPAPEQPAPPVQPSQPAAAAPRGFGGLPAGFGNVGGAPPAQAPGEAPVPASADQVGAGQALTRPGGDVGTLINSSPSVTNIFLQQRNPIVTNPIVRGYRVPQLQTFLDGGFFFPARLDLDTAASKIDPTLIRSATIIKGPYDVRHGPGFAFIIVDTLDIPRYECGCEIHGSTLLNYQTNGEQWLGRQAFWGGGPNFGFRVGYDIKTGNDYETGGGFDEPSSYRSQNFDFALGYWFSKDSHIEFKGLRQLLSNVELPGQAFDISRAKTDAYEVRYVLENQEHFDRLTAEGWYNYSRFGGNNFAPSKRIMIPVLEELEYLGLTSAGVANSGYRAAVTWGKDPKRPQFTIGTDLYYQNQRLDEFDSSVAFGGPVLPGQMYISPLTGLISPFSTFGNFPIPRSHMLDPGVFADAVVPVGERLTVRAGARFDFVTTDVDATPPGFVPQGAPNSNVVTTLSDDLGNESDFPRQYNLYSAYVSGDFKMGDHWTLLATYAVAERPPTLTELYAFEPFLAVLQNGLNFPDGNPLLRPEHLQQIEFGLRLDYENVRGGMNGFYAWIDDFITYNATGTLAGIPDDQPQALALRFTNTDLATLIGGEIFGEFDLTSWLTPFGTVSYVEGRDHDRNQHPTFVNSATGAVDGTVSFLPPPAEEPLPGIPPLEGRLGFRVHEASRNPRWSVEFTTRMVNGQKRIAESLLEAPTPGFTIFGLRSYWQVNKNFLLTAGVENIGDRLYRESVDLRTGFGVFQPGRNYYFGMQFTF